MGIPRTPEKTMLFVGALFSRADAYAEAYAALRQAYGDVIMETPPLAWNYSDHYKDEMSGPLFRRFIFFREFIEPDELSRVKLETNELEYKLSTDSRRNVNLDPGYLTLAKIVLASTKDYSHRIYLKAGIYAETTLIFSKTERKYVPNVNTYNDYRDDRNLRFFMLARELFLLTCGKT